MSQRLLLSAKAERPPHLLVMTATPIPRTLTLTQYGEMDVSRIDEMPPGRTPVETRVISEDKLPEVIDGLGRHIAAGGQAYWVCPLGLSRSSILSSSTWLSCVTALAVQ